MIQPISILRVFQLRACSFALLCACFQVSAGNPFISQRPEHQSIGEIESAYIQQDYARVVLLSDVLIREDPSITDAYFLRGMAYFHQEMIPRAVVDLRHHIDADGAYRDEAVQVAAQLSDAMQRERPEHITKPRMISSLLLQIGGLYDTRVLTRKQGNLFGSETEDAAYQVRANLHVVHGYWLAHYAFRLIEYDTSEDNSRIYQSLESGFRVPVNGGVSAVELTVYADHSFRDYESEDWRLGGRGELSHEINGQKIVWMAAEAGHQLFEHNFDYLDGAYGRLSVGLENYTLDNASLFFEVYGLLQEADLSALGYHQFGGDVNAAIRHSQRFSSGLNLRYAYTSYDDFKDLFLEEREDHVLSSRVWAGIQVTHNSSLVPSIEYYHSQSKLSLADYQRYIFAMDYVVRAW